MRSAILGIVSLAVIVVAAPAMAQEDPCEYSRDIDAAIDVADADSARIVAGAGSLTVEGNAGSTETRIRGRVCADREDWLDDMSVELRRDGDRIEIETVIPERSRSWFSSSRYAYIDLVVEVPATLPVDVRDGSGNLEMHNVAGGSLEDGSGNVTIDAVAGDLEIEDGSGNIVVTGVRGEVRLRDGSGNIDIRDAGSVTVEDDGSGSITISNISGSVVVDEDGSGSITVRNVGGDFTVRTDGSGSVRHSDVSGKVDIPRRKRGRR